MADPVYFYLPCTSDELAAVPRSVDDYWSWQTRAAGLVPYWGRYHWIVQTWMQLRAVGYPAELVNELPRHGVVISHVDCFEYDLPLSRKRFLVAMLVDRDVPLPAAGIHVTHNPMQILRFGVRHRYIPPWPQISLIPRSEHRLDRFENVAFVGYRHNLQSDLATRKFEDKLARLGLRLVVPEPGEWNDYSEFDAVLAVRNFGRQDQHLSKPSLKLFNAWLAGVPAVLGHECAYRAEGLPGIGYLEAVTEGEVLEALTLLRDDVSRRSGLVQAGRRLAQRYMPHATRLRWIQFLEGEAKPSFAEWQRSPLVRAGRVGVRPVLERVLWRLGPRSMRQRPQATVNAVISPDSLEWELPA